MLNEATNKKAIIVLNNNGALITSYFISRVTKHFFNSLQPQFRNPSSYGIRKMPVEIHECGALHPIHSNPRRVDLLI